MTQPALRSWACEIENAFVLVAIGVDQDAHRRILGVQEGHRRLKAATTTLVSIDRMPKVPPLSDRLTP